MSILKGARNLENAKKFYDWALTPDAQKTRRPASSTSCRPARTRRSRQSAALLQHQADPVRLQKVRLVGGAQASARKVGERVNSIRADLPASSFS